MDLNDWLNSDMPNFLSYQFAGNSIVAWASAIATTAGFYLIAVILRRFVLKRVIRLTSRLSSGGATVFEALVGAVRSYLIIIIAIAAGSQLLTLGPKPTAFLDRVGLVALLFQVGFAAIAGFKVWLRHHSRDTFGANSQSLGVLGFLVNIVVWTVLLLVALDNFGINITALLAGLGVGGIAIALATQNILGDIFASMSIVLDKPFVVGDAVEVAEYVGTVEKIGLKTTRIRSISGEQVIVSNADMLNSRLRNHKRRVERRVLFVLGIVYETPPEVLRRVPEIVRLIVGAHEDVRFDRAHFMRFGAYSLDFEVVYFALSADYNRHMDIQQSIYFKILEEFQKQNIEFAYPTQMQFNRVMGNEPPPPHLG